MKTQLTLILLFVAILSSVAQMRVVPGEVSLFENVKLGNVIVEAKYSGANAITDSLGYFSILCADKDVITFKGKAFKPKKFKVTANTDSIIVDLDFKDGSDIVDLAVKSGNISDHDAEFAKANMGNNVDFCKYNDVYDLIEGRIAGVRVMANKDILIRGNTSLNGNNPALLVVDGRIVSSFADVSPCDVKKIDFQKNGAGIYGSIGSGGVVIVQTKFANL